jgi:hypothetical protein
LENNSNDSGKTDQESIIEEVKEEIKEVIKEEIKEIKEVKKDEIIIKEIPYEIIENQLMDMFNTFDISEKPISQNIIEIIEKEIESDISDDEIECKKKTKIIKKKPKPKYESDDSDSDSDSDESEISKPIKKPTKKAVKKEIKIEKPKTQPISLIISKDSKCWQYHDKNYGENEKYLKAVSDYKNAKTKILKDVVLGSYLSTSNLKHFQIEEP